MLNLKKSISLLTAASFAISGCASIVSKSDYPVSFTSSPSEAKFVITDSKGIELHNGKTPAVITLPASNGYFKKASYTIKYEKEGYNSATSTITPSIDGWYFANILLGGVIGMLIVDPLTGAMYKLPDVNNVSLEKNEKSSLDSKSLKIISFGDLTDEQKTQLIRIN